VNVVDGQRQFRRGKRITHFKVEEMGESAVSVGSHDILLRHDIRSMVILQALEEEKISYVNMVYCENSNSKSGTFASKNDENGLVLTKD